MKKTVFYLILVLSIILSNVSNVRTSQNEDDSIDLENGSQGTISDQTKVEHSHKNGFINGGLSRFKNLHSQFRHFQNGGQFQLDSIFDTVERTLNWKIPDSAVKEISLGLVVSFFGTVAMVYICPILGTLMIHKTMLIPELKLVAITIVLCVILTSIIIKIGDSIVKNNYIKKLSESEFLDKHHSLFHNFVAHKVCYNPIFKAMYMFLVVFYNVFAWNEIIFLLPSICIFPYIRIILGIILSIWTSISLMKGRLLNPTLYIINLWINSISAIYYGF